MRLQIVTICLALVMLGATASAHSPIVDANFNDWCFCEDGEGGLCPNPSIRPNDTWDILECSIGTEVAWFDGEADPMPLLDYIRSLDAASEEVVVSGPK